MEQIIIFDPKNSEISLKNIEDLLDNEVIITSDKIIIERLPNCIRTDEVVETIRDLILQSFNTLFNHQGENFAKIHYKQKFSTPVQQFLLSEISELGLSYRASSSLKLNDILKNYELVSSYKDLLRIRNFGHKCMVEVEKVFKTNFITLEVIELIIKKKKELLGKLCCNVPMISQDESFLKFTEMTSGIINFTKYTIGEFNSMNFWRMFQNYDNIRLKRPVFNPSAYEKKFPTAVKMEEFRQTMESLISLSNYYFDFEMRRFITEGY